MKRIGIVGAGQLGWMTLLAGRRYPFEFFVLDDKWGPACTLALEWFPFAKVSAFLDRVDLVLYEFEHIPLEVLELTSRKSPLPPDCLLLKMDRSREKEFLKTRGYPLPEFSVARDIDQLKEAVKRIGYPCVIKQTAYGYDGKGQLVIPSAVEWRDPLFGGPFVVERFVPFDLEVSVIGVRNPRGEIALYPLMVNTHNGGILWYNHPPDPPLGELEMEAQEIVAELMEDLHIVGVLAVEFFVEKDMLLINEIAPRPHNTGHYTLTASQTSQFENFLRVSLGFPPGSTSLLKPGGMVNLIGIPLRDDLLADILSHPTAQLYWYQKEVKRGRKVGHVNFTGETSIQVIEDVVSFARRYPPQMGEGSSAGFSLFPGAPSPSS